MSDPEKVERLTDEQVADAMEESRVAMAATGNHDWARCKNSPPCFLHDRALLQVSADLSEAKEEQERLKADHHSLGRWPDCKWCVEWVNQDMNGAYENSKLEAKLSALQEAAREEKLRRKLFTCGRHVVMGWGLVGPNGEGGVCVTVGAAGYEPTKRYVALYQDHGGQTGADTAAVEAAEAAACDAAIAGDHFVRESLRSLLEREK